jgi:hypothetical protein
MGTLERVSSLWTDTRTCEARLGGLSSFFNKIILWFKFYFVTFNDIYI